ncbi:MAG TPA: SIMPL domain-containing protein, partial [Cryptosporangiaceae bacterium]|nr:SIMPL domain-containing protein [Cryptosporangiaceae bacterium]
MSEPVADGVTVTGLGRVFVRPDLLVARLGAEVTAASVQGALDACSAAAGAIATAMQAAGVAATDLLTSGASVHAAYDERGQVRGWTASQGLTARLRDLTVA